MLIPGFDKIKEASMKAGALGCSISGSGPTIFALSDSKDKAERIASAMSDVFTSLKLESEHYVSAINKSGPRVL
jgi:homoserine kinase